MYGHIGPSDVNVMTVEVGDGCMSYDFYYVEEYGYSYVFSIDGVAGGSGGEEVHLIGCLEVALDEQISVRNNPYYDYYMNLEMEKSLKKTIENLREGGVANGKQ